VPKNPRRRIRVNSMTKPQGFRQMAGARLMLGYSAFVLLLTGVTAVTIYELWAYVSPWTYDILNNCADRAAEVGEQAYQPSQEVVRCTQGVHVTTLILTSLVLVLLLCAAVTLLALASVEYVVRAFVHINEHPPAKLVKRLMKVCRICGYVAFAVGCCFMIILFPVS
jgi:sterol desaturase/sphingolipid hydroxylase (fatty acid hydroxylase superfamily)